MTKEQKEQLMREWLTTPASLRPKCSRVSRSKRAIKKADKAVVRSTSRQIERGEDAAQIWLALKEKNVVTEEKNNKIIHHHFNLEKVTYQEFYQQFVDKTYSKRIMNLLLTLIK